MFRRKSSLRSALVALGSLFAASGAIGQTFRTSVPIAIPEAGVATPYPSVINVVGAPASIQFVTVTIYGFSHRYTDDVGVLLVGPGGQKIVLMNNSPRAVLLAPGIDLSFVSAGGLPQSGGLTAGGFYAPAGGFGPFPAPAPAGPYASNFSGLTGTNANGQWQLWVIDDTIVGGGAFAGGWSITFSETQPTLPTPLDGRFTYQGELTEGGSPVNGGVDVRFTLWNSPSGGEIAVNRLAAPVIVNNVPVTDGRFTAAVNLGSAVPADRKSWVEIEVASPPGSAFVTLSPRQPLAPAPLASKVASSPFAAGALVGSSGNIGVNQHDELNRGVKARVGWAVEPTGVVEFAGMQTIIAPGTAGCGNSSDLGFFTWECNVSASREIMRISGSGNVGIGTSLPQAKLDVTTVGVGAGWQTMWNNTAAIGFRAGARLADSGFFEMTNNANLTTPNFARLASTGAWSAVSDGRMKTDVTNAENNLAAAMKLRPVNFRWKATGAPDFGLIAQDVRGVLPTLVVGDEATESLTVNYSQLSVVAIGAIQEQQRVIQSQQEQIEALKASLAKIEAALAAQAHSDSKQMQDK